MNFVDEQDGLFAVQQAAAREFDDTADFFDSGGQSRQSLEPAAGSTRDQRCERGLAGAGRSVQKYRCGAGPLDHSAEWRAGPE